MYQKKAIISIQLKNIIQAGYTQKKPPIDLLESAIIEILKSKAGSEN
jgi:hypothetical protein